MLENVKSKIDGAVVTGAVVASSIVPAFAEDVFDVAGSMFETAYGKLLMISTPVCAVVIIVSLIIAGLGGEKGMEKGRKAAIGVGIAWICINGLGLFLNFIQPFIANYSNLGW